MGPGPNPDRRRLDQRDGRDCRGPAALQPAAFPARADRLRGTAGSEGSGRRADVRPSRHAAARHGRRPVAGPRCLHHRLDRRRPGAGFAGPVRPERLCRSCCRLPATAWAGRACYRGVPALGASAGRGFPDGGGWRPLPARFHDPDGRPGRYAEQPDKGQRIRQAAQPGLVRALGHRPGAVRLRGLQPAGLSRIPAAHRLHVDEFRPPFRRPSEIVRPSDPGRTANSTTNICR